MKLKYYLRGLGIGILITTILLMITSPMHKTELSDEEVIARARKLGMVMQTEMSADEGIPKATDQEPLESESAATEQVQTESEQASGEPQSQTPAEPEKSESDKAQTEQGNSENGRTPAETENSENKGTPVEPERPTDDKVSTETGSKKDKTPEKTVKEFTIQRGESSNAVAANLQTQGLVDDAEKFNDYLVNQGYDNHILPGTVQIQEGASYKQIAEALITKREQ